MTTIRLNSSLNSHFSLTAPIFKQLNMTQAQTKKELKGYPRNNSATKKVANTTWTFPSPAHKHNLEHKPSPPNPNIDPNTLPWVITLTHGTIIDNSNFSDSPTDALSTNLSETRCVTIITTKSSLYKRIILRLNSKNAPMTTLCRSSKYQRTIQHRYTQRRQHYFLLETKSPHQQNQNTSQRRI